LGDRVSRYREAFNTVLVQPNTETPIPDGQRSHFRISPLTMPSPCILEPRVSRCRCHVLYSTKSLWDPSQLGTSLFLRVSSSVENTEVPNPNSARSRATCPRSNRWSRLSWGITARDLDVHGMIALANPDMPIHDGRRVLPALEDCFFQKFKSLVLFLLKSSPLHRLRFVWISLSFLPLRNKSAIPLELL
jgi:hypothetical protein